MSKTIQNSRAVESCEKRDGGYYVKLKRGWGFVGLDGANEALILSISDFRNSLPHNYGDARGASVEDQTKMLAKGFEAQAAAMQEFGYPSVTADVVKSHHEEWLDGKDEGGVVFKFSKGSFEKNPSVFGERK